MWLVWPFWAPDINLFRDPRWGRGQEVPGEDPTLTAEYVYHYSRGLQEGDDPRYLKVSLLKLHQGVMFVEENFNVVIEAFWIFSLEHPFCAQFRRRNMLFLKCPCAWVKCAAKHSIVQHQCTTMAVGSSPLFS